MASRYDPAKKCRVGTMDEEQFYAEANQANGRYFKSLLGSWQKKGGSIKWGAGGVGLRASAGGKEVGICFLAPAYAKKKDRVELSLTTLSKQIGASDCQKLKVALQKAAGDRFTGSSMVCIVEPGGLPPGPQKLLSAALFTIL